MNTNNLEVVWCKEVTILVVCLIMANFFGCIPEECGDRGTNYKYDLVTNVTILPAQKAYRVGDTITMEAVLPRKAYNREKDEFATILDQNLTHLSWVTRIDSIYDGAQDATHYIQVLLDTVKYPSLSLTRTAVSGKWNSLPSGDYGVGYRFVLRRPGVYHYGFNGSRDYERLVGTVTLQDPCPNGKYSYYNEVNDGANNNIDLMCQTNEVFCTPSWNSPKGREDLDRVASYVFKVVE